MAKELKGFHIRCAENGYEVEKRIIDDKAKPGSPQFYGEGEEPYLCLSKEGLLEYISKCIDEYGDDDDKKVKGKDGSSGKFAMKIGHRVMAAIAEEG